MIAQKSSLTNTLLTDQDTFNLLIEDAVYTFIKCVITNMYGPEYGRCINVTYNKDMDPDKHVVVTFRISPINPGKKLVYAYFCITPSFMYDIQETLNHNFGEVREDAIKKNAPRKLFELYSAIEDDEMLLAITLKYLSIKIYARYVKIMDLPLARLSDFESLLIELLTRKLYNSNGVPCAYLRCLLINYVGSITHKYWNDNYEKLIDFVEEEYR